MRRAPGSGLCDHTFAGAAASTACFTPAFHVPKDIGRIRDGLYCGDLAGLGLGDGGEGEELEVIHGECFVVEEV